MLGSYSFGSLYGKDYVPEDVLHLFYNALNEGQNIEYVSEIVFAGMDGRIALDKYFNLQAYIYAIEQNGGLANSRKGKKFISLDTTRWSADDDNEGVLSEERLVIEEVESEIDKLLDDDELVYAIRAIKGLNNDLLITEGVNLISLMKTALNGIPKAIAELRRICDFYPSISESVQVVLGCGRSFEEVLALA